MLILLQQASLSLHRIGLVSQVFNLFLEDVEIDLRLQALCKYCNTRLHCIHPLCCKSAERNSLKIMLHYAISDKICCILAMVLITISQQDLCGMWSREGQDSGNICKRSTFSRCSYHISCCHFLNPHLGSFVCTAVHVTTTHRLQVV